MPTTCVNVEHGSCTSRKMNEKPDMSTGDTCLLCLCRECERCGRTIDLDCENQVADGQGYFDVCDNCLLDSDVLY